MISFFSLSSPGHIKMRELSRPREIKVKERRQKKRGEKEKTRKERKEKRNKKEVNIVVLFSNRPTDYYIISILHDHVAGVVLQPIVGTYFT